MENNTTQSIIFMVHEKAIQLINKSEAKDIYDLLNYISENPEIIDYNPNADLKKNENYLMVNEWLTLTLAILMLDGTSLRINTGERPENLLYGSHIDINERESNIWHTNLSSISFFSFYPSILYHIVDDYRFNISGFNTVYKRMYELRINKKGLSQVAYHLNKVWLNMAYGVLASGTRLHSIERNIIKDVTTKGSLIMKKLQNEFIGHFIYADTDTIYYKHFNEIENRLVKIIKKYPYLRYEINQHSGIFMRKKSYILQDTDSSLSIKGIKIK